jgi:hypothetical protein
MNHDWYDLHPHGERHCYPFRVQWCMRTNNVRAKHNHETNWRYDRGKHSIRNAEYVGEQLLEER